MISRLQKQTASSSIDKNKELRARINATPLCYNTNDIECFQKIIADQQKHVDYLNARHDTLEKKLRFEIQCEEKKTFDCRMELKKKTEALKALKFEFSNAVQDNVKLRKKLAKKGQCERSSC